MKAQRVMKMYWIEPIHEKDWLLALEVDSTHSVDMS